MEHASKWRFWFSPLLEAASFAVLLAHFGFDDGENVRYRPGCTHRQSNLLANHTPCMTIYRSYINTRQGVAIRIHLRPILDRPARYT